MPKTYGQFCALARALDHVGDRWTLLVIRELLLGDATYGHLLAALEGVPTNLLADRLRDLESDGLVIREREPEDRRRVTYGLTPLGRGLEPAILALIAWGAHWMAAGPGDDRFDPRWATIALRALLTRRTASVPGTVEMHLAGDTLTVSSTPGTALHVAHGTGTGTSDATVEGDGAALLGLVSGHLTLTAAKRRGVRVRGNRALVRALLQP